MINIVLTLSYTSQTTHAKKVILFSLPCWKFSYLVSLMMNNQTIFSMKVLLKSNKRNQNLITCLSKEHKNTQQIFKSLFVYQDFIL